MGNNWQTMPFSEAILLNPSVPLKRGTIYPFVDMQTVMPSSKKVKSVENRVFDGGGARFRVGDVLMARITPSLEHGKISRFAADNPATIAHGSTEFIVIRGKPDVTDTDFAYYLTRWDYVHSFAVSQMTGSSGRQRVPTDSLRFIDVPVPPLPEQRAIAGILGALDDKIELNRRMNRTLESMARAVFQEMMKEGGGKETTIGEVVTVVGGSTPSTSNPVFWDGGDIHWATPKDLSALQDPILLDTNSRITDVGLQEISSGLLPVGTVLLSSRAPIGYLAITQIPTAINQGFIAIKCTEEAPNYFILNWLKDNMEEIIGRANGTTFLEISKSNFRPMPIFIPSHEKMEKFVKTAEPLYQKMVANLKESRALANLRDSLLPKLMRGEVRVTSEQ